MAIKYESIRRLIIATIWIVAALPSYAQENIENKITNQEIAKQEIIDDNSVTIDELFSSDLQSPQYSVVTRSDDDLVLAELRIDRTVLHDAVAGYISKSGLVLPLSQIAQLLEFAIKVSPQEGQAEGWIINPENKFSLDVARSEYVLSGKRVNFQPEQIEVYKDDIYVNIDLLGEWFGVDFDFSYATQSINLTPHSGVRLPIQAKTERAQARRILERSSGKTAEGPLARQEIPYQLASAPYTDITYTGGYDKRAYSGLHNNASAVADNDMLYMQSRIYAAADDSQQLTDLRWTLSRRDPDGKILQSDDKLKNTRLGELLHKNNITEVSFGDISTQQLPLTAFNQQGRGALISNIPYDRATQYDRTTLQGDLQAGWEVELYRNDELLSFQRASANGRYEFVDVPLISGLNIIRLVFYGPFGETREETQRFLVTADLIKKGESFFRASVSQQNTNSFDVLSQNQITSLSGATPTQSEAVKGKARAMFEHEYGLRDNISLFSSITHLTTPDDIARNYVSAGIGSTIGGTYGRVDLAQDVANGGNAVKILAQDQINGVSVSAEHQQFFNFVSEFTESANDSVTRRSTARSDSPLNLPYLPSMNNGVDITQVLYESDREINEVGYHLSTAINRLAVSHNLSYRTDSSPSAITVTGIGGVPFVINTREKQTLGELIMSFPFRRFFIRGNVIYALTPEQQIQTLFSAAEYNLSERTNLLLQTDKQLIGDKLTTVTLGLNRNFNKFRLGSNISHDNEGETTAGVTLSLSLGKDPRSGKWSAHPEYNSGSGIVLARAYNDANNDKIFNEGDEALENARFMVNRGSRSDYVADSNAVAILRGVQADTKSSLTLDSSSIDNPYLMSNQAGVEIVARPGVVAKIDIPVSSSGDAEGTVHIITLEGEKKEAAKVSIQLLNQQGEILRETQTSFDGYYLINAIPAGNYILRVSPEQAGRLGFIAPPPRNLQISNSETDSHVIDLEIIREPETTVPALTFNKEPEIQELEIQQSDIP